VKYGKKGEYALKKSRWWGTERIEWLFKCCKISGWYRISPVGIIGGDLPLVCPKCKKTKAKKPKFAWEVVNENE
jgi:hypothetical protein